MSLADAFPDIESELVSGLPSLLVAPGGETISAGTVTPDDLEEVVPYVRVTVIDDPDDGITRRATVTFEHFAASRATAYALGEQTRGILLSKRAIGGLLIDKVLTVSGPKRVPWDNQNLRRFLSTYRISTRR